MSALVRIVPSGHQFEVQANESLLQAALRSGLALEFGCTNGACGECKGRVIEGAVRSIRHHDYVIRESEKQTNTVLLCCCSADGDVTIEAGEAGGPEDIPEQSVRARLTAQERASDDVDILRVHVMRGKMLRFLAGQHARVTLAGAQGVDVSIASCPCDGANLEFHLQRGGFGELGARAAAGFRRSDRLLIEGPRGRFTLDEGSRRPLLFIAAGVAVAPIKSIIEHAINLELSQAMHLHWYTKGAGGHYLHNYFRSLCDALDEFDYVPMSGDISSAAVANLPELSGVDAYVSGDEPFVNTLRALLYAEGLPPERLFVDALNQRPDSAPRAD